MRTPPPCPQLPDAGVPRAGRPPREQSYAARRRGPPRTRQSRPRGPLPSTPFTPRSPESTAPVFDTTCRPATEASPTAMDVQNAGQSVKGARSAGPGRLRHPIGERRWSRPPSAVISPPLRQRPRHSDRHRGPHPSGPNLPIPGHRACAKQRTHATRAVRHWPVPDAGAELFSAVLDVDRRSQRWMHSGPAVLAATVNLQLRAGPATPGQARPCRTVEPSPTSAAGIGEPPSAAQATRSRALPGPPATDPVTDRYVASPTHQNAVVVTTERAPGDLPTAGHRPCAVPT